ncbi:MAG: GAF domain-containing protein [Anaerolineae bacterium]
MRDKEKTKEQLIEELQRLRQRVAALQESENERKRAEEESKRRAAQLATLHEASTVVASRLTLEEIFEAVIQSLSKALDYRLIGIYLVKEGMLELKAQVGYGSPDDPDILADVPLEKGVLGRTARTGQPQLLSNVKGDPDFWTDVPGITSEVCVPLKRGDEVLGVLNVESDRVDKPLDVSDVQLLTLLSSHIVIAIENARLFEEIRQRAQEMEAINKVGRAITSVLDLDEVLRQIVDITKARFGHYFVGIALVKGDQLIFSNGSTIGDSDVRLPSGQVSIGLTHRPSLTAEAARTGQPVLANDVLSDPRYLAVEELPDTRSELCMPVKAKGRVIGVLHVQSDQPDAFEQTDVIVLQSLASQAGVAIENARLYETIQQELAERKRTEEALRQSEERFRLAIEAARDGLWENSLDHKRDFFSDSMFTMLGYEPLAPADAFDFFNGLVHPDDFNNFEEKYNALNQPGHDDYAVEMRLKAKDGTWRHILSRGKCVERDEEGRAVRVVGIHTDITDLKRAEEALRMSEQRYRLLFERNLAGVYRTTVDGQVLDCNKSFARILGYDSPEEILGCQASEFYFDPANRQAFVTQLQEQATLVNREHRLRRKDGSPVWVLENSALLKGEEGSPPFLQSTMVPITERKQAQEALERHAIQLALINDISGKIAAVLDLDSLLDRAARLVQKSFDYHHVALFTTDREQGEVVMRARAGDFADLFPPNHRLKLGQGMVGWVGLHGEGLLANDVDAEPRYVNRYPDVITTRSELSVPIRVGEKVVGVLDAQSPQLNAFSESDVMVMETLADQIAVAIENARLFEETQRRVREMQLLYDVGQAAASEVRLEETLQAAAEALAAEFEDIHVALMLLDPESGTLHVESSVGYSLDMVNNPRLPLGEGITGWVAQHGKPLLVPDVRLDPRYYEGASDTRSELCVPLAVGSQVIGVINVESAETNAFTEDDRRLLSTLANNLAILIERARLFEKVEAARTELQERAEALARSNAELEQFAYVASHDLQEPLRKVRAFGDRFEAKYADMLDERGRDYLERMQGAASRMQEMINDLLTLSRVTTRAQPFVPVDLRQLADEAVSDLEIRIERSSGRVEIDELPTIEADPIQMRQLLGNLIGNALKFQRKGKSPVVKVYGKLLDGQERHGEPAPGSEMATATDSAKCQIFVQDNGIGFDEKYLERIFQPFQRLHGRSEYEGSGMGLAICRKIAERHGGSITAQSTPGQGATFIVTLPVNQPKGEKAS